MIKRSIVYCLMATVMATWASRTAAQPPIQLGHAAVTCFSGYIGFGPAVNTNGFVMGVIDIRNPSPSLVGLNWWPAPPMWHNPTWTAQNMGQVFGISLDAPGNMYVTATRVYGNFAYGPQGSGGVYKVNGVTGAIVPNFVITDPSPSANTVGQNKIPNTGSGLGNIAFDRTHNQFFVTNFEDGRIYRINSAGVVQSRHDPYTPDGGTAGPAPLGERLWGVGVFNNRVYYSVWWEDGANNSVLVQNEIRSVQIDAVTGDFVAGTDIHEIWIPALAPNQFSHPIADIEFSAAGKMLLAERTMYNLDPSAHQSRVLEYTGNTPASWGTAKQFYVGNYSVGENAAGGVDYGYRGMDATGHDVVDCDSAIWATGDALRYSGFNPDGGWGLVYGMARMPASGNTPGVTPGTGVKVTSHYVDFDMDTTTSFKLQIGDVDIFHFCRLQQGEINPCDSIRITAQQVQGGAGIPDRSCCWKIRINNQYQANYFTTVQAQVITPGVSFASTSAPTGWGNTYLNATTTTWAPTSGSIPLGVSDSLIFCLDIGNTTSQQIEVTLISANGTVCKDTIDLKCQPPIVVPPCVGFVESKIECKESGPNGAIYVATFSVKNNTIYTMHGIDFHAVPIGSFGISPNTITFGSPLPPGGVSAPQTITITGATPGSTICIGATLHDNGNFHCCTDTVCIKLPPCKNCCDGFRVRQGEMSIKFNASGGVTLNTAFSVGPHPVMGMSATIVSSSIKRSCNPASNGNVAGNIVGASTIAGLPGPVIASPPVPTGMSHEATWGMNPTGVSMSGFTPLQLQMSFPAPPPYFPKNCRDTLKFCIRYRFTDTSCRTCDTLICYQVVRKGFIIIGTPVDHGQLGIIRNPQVEGDGEADDPRGTKSRDASTQGAGPGAEDDPKIVMTSDTDGKLTVKIPDAPEGSGPDETLTVVDLNFEPMVGVNLVSMTDDANSQQATIADRVARMKTSLAQGAERTYTLKYSNPFNAKVWANILTLRYVFAVDPSDTLAGMFIVYARTPGGEGGDTLTRDASAGEKRDDVRTYALKFTSGSVTGDSIASVVIRTKGDARILAVGPGTDSMSVTLQVYADAEGNPYFSVAQSSGTEAMAVAKGTTLGPIYVTVAGAEGDATVFEYETSNPQGGVVSTGEVEITDPLSAALPIDGTPGMVTAMALAGCYPNPATGAATIRFFLPKSEPSIWLTVSDVSGRELLRLVDDQQIARGMHEIGFDASQLPSGTYYYTLRTLTETQTRSMTVVR